MLCTLEATDGGGKSTLARRLASDHLNVLFGDGKTGEESCGVTLLHKGKPPEGLCPFTEYETALQEEPLRGQIFSTTHLVVMDRWAAGEIIYGNLYRGDSRLTEEGMAHVELALSAVGAVKVLCQPQSHVEVERRVEKLGGDGYLKSGDLKHVHHQYEVLGKAYEWRRVPDLHVAYQSLIVNGDARQLAAKAKTVAALSQGTYLGSLHPQVLLCGDKRGDGPLGRPDLRLPFTPTVKGSSSEYLLRALELAGLTNAVGVVNTNDQVVKLASLWEELGRPSLVALGAAADASLRLLGLRGARVPHPQYERRFKAGRHEEYARLISEAAAA
jgi:hypothetical protein